MFQLCLISIDLDFDTVDLDLSLLPAYQSSFSFG